MFQTFQNKRILVTGHTGFKGQWLCETLNLFGAEIYGLATTDAYHPIFSNLAENVDEEILCDIRNFDKLKTILMKVKPQVIFHFAAQALVPEAHKYPIQTWETNSIGTLNLLEAVQELDYRPAIIAATTDKVYKFSNKAGGNQENDELGGNEHYSLSKVASELILKLYSTDPTFKYPISAVRSGNVIGGGDTNLSRIIPGIIHALEIEEELEIRNLIGVRPWLHVLDSISGYLTVAHQMLSGRHFTNSVWNLGPSLSEHLSVREILEIVKEIHPTLKFKEKVQNSLTESDSLLIDASKINKELGWKPQFTTKQAIEKTLCWYMDYSDKKIATSDQTSNYFNSLERGKSEN